MNISSINLQLPLSECLAHLENKLLNGSHHLINLQLVFDAVSGALEFKKRLKMFLQLKILSSSHKDGSLILQTELHLTGSS